MGQRQGTKLAVNRGSEPICTLHAVFGDEGSNVGKIDERYWAHEYGDHYLRPGPARVVSCLRPSRFSSETLHGRAGPLRRPS
jgi:hypothetical protein